MDGTEAITEYLLDVEPATAQAALRGPGKQGIYVNRYDRGYAIFCSGLAWSQWTVSDPLFRRVHNALFLHRSKIEWIDGKAPDAPTKEPCCADGYEIARFATGYALQNRSTVPVTATIRIDQQTVTHLLAPRSVLLHNDGKEFPLGSGLWKDEKVSH